MAIEFERVNYEYQAFDGKAYLALADVNLSINLEGEFIALVGETGSGKSTLAQHMNALLTPTQGRVRMFGLTISRDTTRDKHVKLNPIRQKVGLVFQFPEYQLFEETVLKDITFGPRNYGVSEEEATARAKKAIHTVGLDSSYLERSPFSLSGGEKKRVSIAGILAMEPSVLVLDEPTSGLDPLGRKALLEVFKNIHEQEGKSVMLITHDMDAVYEYAKRVLVMREGNVVYDGAPSQLFTRRNIRVWNLDVPDVLKVTFALKDRFNLEVPGLPRNRRELLEAMREVLA